MQAAILVVGVRSGLGQAVAQKLISCGRTVIGTVRSPDQIEEVRESLP